MAALFQETAGSASAGAFCGSQLSGEVGTGQLLSFSLTIFPRPWHTPPPYGVVSGLLMLPAVLTTYLKKNWKCWCWPLGGQMSSEARRLACTF